MKRTALFLGSVLSVALFSACGSSDDGLKPPVAIEASTIGDICKAARKGLETNPVAKVVAMGSCEEQETLSGGRALWIELSDFSQIDSSLSEAEMKYLMVSVPVGLTLYGFRIAKERLSDFDQLFYSFRDARGSYFELAPSELESLMPEQDIPQDEWDSLVDDGVRALLPKIIILYAK